MNQPEEITRRELGALAAPLLPSPWSQSLAEAMDWNPRTVERLGTPKMRLDARRATLAAECLEDADQHADAAAEIAAWLRARVAAMKPCEGSKPCEP